jgi:hypothetical protein
VAICSLLFGYESESAEAEHRIKLQLPLLSSRLSLFDVNDVEALCGSEIRRSSLNLSPQDWEELLVYLIESVWEASLRFEPGVIRSKSTVNPDADGQGFGCWARLTLRRRIVDWQRAKLGRTKWQFKGRVHIRELPTIVPFDDSARDRLEQSFAERDGDREASGDLSFAGLDSEGDWQRARDLELLGLEPPRRVTR